MKKAPDTRRAKTLSWHFINPEIAVGFKAYEENREETYLKDH